MCSAGDCKSDLLMIAVLMPLAATNLRAAAPDVVAASDASNWGEAGVYCNISPMIGRELMRHSLRKSVWTTLLSPSRALLKAYGELPEDEELPEAEEPYKTNALWTLWAECLTYRLLFARERRGRRHINIGEVRGVLRTEKLLGPRKPSRRILLGANSEVALGALTEGRSSSTAINEELCRSLPWMIALDSYLDLMYIYCIATPAATELMTPHVARKLGARPGRYRSGMSSKRVFTSSLMFGCLSTALTPSA